MTRRYDPRRAKLHLSYSARELCDVFDVALGTVRAWTKKGLRPIDRKRPFLFSGSTIREFLEKHNQPRQPMGPGEIYCVACKRVIEPAERVVDFVPLGPSTGNFVGTCPSCGRSVCRRVRKNEIFRQAGRLKVRFEGGTTAF